MEESRITEDYLVCALWSSSDTTKEGEEIMMEDYEISDEFRKQANEDCIAFLEHVEKELPEEYVEQWEAMEDSQIGHDFWLTRCGHGAGFWDHGLGKLGDILTDFAKTYGNVDLYLGDDELVYSN